MSDLFAPPTEIELVERQQKLQDQLMALFLKILGELKPPLTPEEVASLCQKTVFYSNLDINTGAFREKPFMHVSNESYVIINSLKEKISELRPNLRWLQFGVLDSGGQTYWGLNA